MEITFQRRLTNELLTTFVPSFFLLGISFATTYFKAFYFEANVTVNLTVMLVATTLFIRYSFDCLAPSKLRKTFLANYRNETLLHIFIKISKLDPKFKSTIVI